MNTVIQTPLTSVAIVGLGYVGLPTALALHGRCQHVIGIDISQDRLDVINSGKADLNEADQAVLAEASVDGTFEMTTRVEDMREADAVRICVPTPVTTGNLPDLAMNRIRVCQRGELCPAGADADSDVNDVRRDNQ